eukprot:990567-Pyramimonas_sp.AAC.1
MTHRSSPGPVFWGGLSGPSGAYWEPFGGLLRAPWESSGRLGCLRAVWAGRRPVRVVLGAVWE